MTYLQGGLHRVVGFGDLRLVPEGCQVVQSTQGIMDKILWTALFQ